MPTTRPSSSSRCSPGPLQARPGEPAVAACVVELMSLLPLSQPPAFHHLPALALSSGPVSHSVSGARLSVPPASPHLCFPHFTPPTSPGPPLPAHLPTPPPRLAPPAPS